MAISTEQHSCNASRCVVNHALSAPKPCSARATTKSKECSAGGCASCVMWGSGASASRQRCWSGRRATSARPSVRAQRLQDRPRVPRQLRDALRCARDHKNPHHGCVVRNRGLLHRRSVRVRRCELVACCHVAVGAAGSWAGDLGSSLATRQPRVILFCKAKCRFPRVSA